MPIRKWAAGTALDGGGAQAAADSGGGGGGGGGAGGGPGPVSGVCTMSDGCRDADLHF